MKLRRLARNKIRKLKIPGSAKARHAEIQRKIKSKIPKNGEELGKTIERKISSSQRIWSNVAIAIFGQRALENISHHSNYFLGLVTLILTDIVMIFPTDLQSLAPNALINNFIVVLAGLLIANGVTYAAMRIIGSKTSFKVFFSTVNTALFMSLLVVAIPAALVSFAIFNTMLRSQSAITLFFSIIPFYNYLVYGWASESLAKLKGIKSIIVALISLLVILLLNMLLGAFII